MGVRRFLFDNFLAFMSGLSLLMCWLSTTGHVPQTSWKDSPRFYGVMSGFFAVAAVLIRPTKPVPFTEGELQAMRKLRIGEISRWLKAKAPWADCPEPSDDNAEFLDAAKRLRDKGAELWTYDSGAESWESLGGECGYAIVHENQVVEYCMVEEN